MRTPEITDTVIQRLKVGDYRFIAANFANADMVAHTGNLTAAVEAVEAIDVCLGRLWKAVKAKGGYLVITADHGNVEEMIDTTTGAVLTEHSIYPVPFIVAGPGLLGYRELPQGILADVAPTILDVMTMRQPPEMTGRSLLSE
jgi:2,3-bisphosphoglycerate-independent phosphoglycerate mutase